MFGVPLHGFEYQGKTYNILGMHGGKPLSLRDISIEAPVSKAADWVGIYAVNPSGQLILKKVMLLKSAWIMWESDVNQIVPMTGHILFSSTSQLGLEMWDLRLNGMSMSTIPDGLVEKSRFFEAEIVEGHVTQITDCTQEIEARLKERSLQEVTADSSKELTPKEQAQAFWDLTAQVLPRRYDILMYYYTYTHFPSGMPLVE